MRSPGWVQIKCELRYVGKILMFNAVFSGYKCLTVNKMNREGEPSMKGKWFGRCDQQMNDWCL